MPEETYEYPDEVYDALAAAGVPWQDADFVLRWSRPVVRQHIGATTLLIIGRARDGRWLLVALYEVDDDVYRLRGARWLTDGESGEIRATLGMEQP